MAVPVDTIRILHVDDERDFTDLTADFLEREDDRFTVETAASASEGLDRLEESAWDCVISDHDMPGMNGIKFLKELREDYPDLPVILYTGKGSEEVASDAISAGVTDYLQKDAGTSQYTVLANRIRNAVEKYYTHTELAEREKRLKLFFEQSPLGVVEWDENFNCVRLNNAAEQILGYDEDTLVGRSWEDIVPESDQEVVGQIVSDLLANAGGYRSVNKNIRENAELIVCEWHNRVVTDDSGDVVAIFSQFQDITERRERERELKRERDRLDEFAGVVSHDIQNALTVAQGRLEVVQENYESEHLGAIETALDRINRITEDVLWLARHGRDIGAMDAVRLAETIDGAWDIVVDRVENAELHYLENMGSPVAIEADDDRLRQLFENLFSNAIQHGGADITVTVGMLDGGFYVEDNGSGIPEDRRTDVFTAGYSTNDEGTGFGLSIVKQIVEAHGWEVDVVESSEGGARFEITGVEFITK